MILTRAYNRGMAGMNANIPPLHCYVRSQFTNGENGYEIDHETATRRRGI